MGHYPSFASYLSWRSGAVNAGEPAGRGGNMDDDQLAERRSAFRGIFKVVNPARPASPLNSRLLSSPYRKRLKGQVMGR